MSMIDSSVYVLNKLRLFKNQKRNAHKKLS